MPWDTPRHIRTGCRILTPDLVNHLVNLTSPPERHNPKTEGPKVTDSRTFFFMPPR